MAILSQSVECVDVLCQHPNVEIGLKETKDAISEDNVEIVEILFQTILRQHDIDDWKSIEALGSSSMIIKREFYQCIYVLALLVHVYEVSSTVY